jgi:hypothetical protein
MATTKKDVEIKASKLLSRSMRLPAFVGRLS